MEIDKVVILLGLGAGVGLLAILILTRFRRSIARGLLLILASFALVRGILLISVNAARPATTPQPIEWLTVLGDIADMARLIRGESQQLAQPEPAKPESRSNGSAGWLCAGAMGALALTAGASARFITSPFERRKGEDDGH